VFFNNAEYIYESSGVIRAGETIHQFQDNPIEDIMETREEFIERARGNKSRLDVHFLTTTEYAGRTFISEVPGGRRVYDFREEKSLNSSPNDLIASLGMMLMVAGMLMLVYSFRFRNS
jgi:hypothetical protein